MFQAIRTLEIINSGCLEGEEGNMRSHNGGREEGEAACDPKEATTIAAEGRRGR